MTMSNGTSTSIGVRAAHGDTANAACSSASSSRPRRQSRVDGAGQVVEVEQPLGAVEPLHPVVKCGAQQGMRVGPGRQPTAQPLRGGVGVAAQFDQAADRQLQRAASRAAGRSAARSRSASSASTSAAQPVDVVGRSRPSSPDIACVDQRGAAVHVVAARARRGRRARPLRLRLSRNGFGSPSAGAGAQCSTTPHGSHRRRSDASMMSLSSQRKSDGPRGLASEAPQWWPDSSRVSSARVSATYSSLRSSSTRRCSRLPLVLGDLVGQPLSIVDV